VKQCSSDARSEGQSANSLARRRDDAVKEAADVRGALWEINQTSSQKGNEQFVWEEGGGV